MAGHFPASALAKLVGIHVNTAVRWIYRAGADTFAAEISRGTQPRPATDGH
ncbi:hypothetical protein [Kutzneria sp. CA-103260]|uniref:hypothetical protein n=1 Tax=Kutzneria sp. CA-103260 TaxID=2802641 RepID=UPI001BA73BAF|nr:hypothetical protein [Kutzneria sp. CA-103260]